MMRITGKYWRYVMKAFFPRRLTDQMCLECFNSIDTGTSQTSVQAKVDGRPNIAAKFPPPFFVRVSRPDQLGEKEGFLRIRTVPPVIVVFEDCWGISLIFERGTWTFPNFEIPLIQCS
ncbi:hypothetical protein AVEN_257829-1 [Araneus ventricosus]|uniref:Uncharacterized protein n=1 Tax=Araneus ventricosus TaxID=182803 RepID=A0A4Y2M846_ARAVE|nr:hypothetical protein AVEN_257829-1 [Araneus ventricosus]